MTFFCDKNDNKDESLANAGVVKVLARRFGIGQWSVIGPGSEKVVLYQRRQSHKEPGTILRKKCCWNSQKADILFSVQRLHCPGVSSKAMDEESCRYTSLQIKTQLKNLRTIKIERGEPVILVGQSIVLGEVKAETPLHDEDPMNDQIILAAIHSTN